jgi:hypothetical protein
MLEVAPDEQLFFFMFDFHSYFERKNPLAVVEAFKQAFAPTENARLVVKCLNSHTDERALRRMQDAARGHRVQILTEYVSRDKVTQFLAACDVYVSLHRSEGIGLTMGEAMALGKPVIATAWSGNVDFMDISNSFPVSFDLVAIEQDVGPYRAGQMWAHPSVEHAAAIMRQIFDTPEIGHARGDAGRQHVRRHFSPERVAGVIAERLSIIEERRRVVPPRTRLTAPTSRWSNRDLVGELREVLITRVPPDATVAVVSRGDPELVRIDGRVGWHFPRTEDGTYAGYYPADSATAIAHLEGLRAKGAEYLLVPATSEWWLEYYIDFRAHLDRHHQLVVASDVGTLYRLDHNKEAGVVSTHIPIHAQDGAVESPVDSPIGQVSLLTQLYLGLEPEGRRTLGEPAWSGAFLDWATRSSVETTGLSPFLDLVYRLRADVAATFPEIRSAHRDAFLAWAATQGAVEMGYDPGLADMGSPFSGSPDNGTAAPGQPETLGPALPIEGDAIEVRFIVDPRKGIANHVTVTPVGAIDGASR